MKCSMQITKLRVNAPFYSKKDFDERLGGNFTMFIVPLKGNDDGLFYYVRKLDNGKLEIEGEGYIITNGESLKYHKDEARKEMVKYELEGENVMYYWLDGNGNVVEKTNK